MAGEGYIDIEWEADTGITVDLSIKGFFVGFESDFVEFRSLRDSVELIAC